MYEFTIDAYNNKYINKKNSEFKFNLIVLILKVPNLRNRHLVNIFE